VRRGRLPTSTACSRATPLDISESDPARSMMTRLGLPSWAAYTPDDGVVGRSQTNIADLHSIWIQISEVGKHRGDKFWSTTNPCVSWLIPRTRHQPFARKSRISRGGAGELESHTRRSAPRSVNSRKRARTSSSSP
jgi:hypothetical protein